MSFDALKKNRSKSLDTLAAQLTKAKKGGGTQRDGDDDRYWKLTRGADGNGHAVIRFLPAPANEENPFVLTRSYAFQGPTGKWYFNKSLITIGQADPVADHNRPLWASKDEAKIADARKRKEKKQYVSNILVVKDPANPDNEGKVFLFGYGKKIFDMLNDAMFPEFEGDEPLNPFDMWEGANFRLRVRNGEGGFPNYDKSEFEGSSPVSEDDDTLRQIYESEHSLTDLIDPKHFKSYDELKARLDEVLGLTGGAAAAQDDEVTDYVPQPTRREKAAPEAPVRAPKAAPVASVEDDDDDLAYFANMAKGD